MILGLILALASAVATNLAFLFKHRGAVLAPPIEVRHPLRSAAGLFRSKWFAVGWAVAIVAWFLHVGALSAPRSRSCRRSCPATVLPGRVRRALLRLWLGRRQWVGLTITAAGLVVIELTAAAPNEARLAAALIAVEGAIAPAPRWSGSRPAASREPRTDPRCGRRRAVASPRRDRPSRRRHRDRCSGW